MKKITILLLLIFNFALLFSQNYQITWQKCFGGSEQDNAEDILKIPDGYLIIGWTESYDGDISFNNGGSDGWIIRTDSTGNITWEKTYGGTKGDNFFRIFGDNNGNYFILGASNSSDGDVSFDPYTDSWDLWILKIDIEGNIIWDKIVGGSYGDNIWNGSPTLDGGVIATGWTYSNDGDVSVNYGGGDTWTVKLSPDGEVEWDYTIGTDWIDKGQAAIQTSDGGYLISSNSIILEDGIGNITCIPHSYGWMDGVLFKLDSNLNVQWQHCYGGSNSDGIFGITEIEDGYVISAGTSSNNGDVSGFHGENDNWIVKLDFEGNIIWQKCLGGSRYEFTSNSIESNDHNLTIVGGTSSNDGDVSGNHSLSEYDYDIWFVKLSSEGVLLSQQCFGGAGNEELYFGVVKKSDNDYVIAAQTDYGPSFDVGCAPHGGYWDKDFWVFEIKDCSQYFPATPAAPTGDDTVCTEASSTSMFSIVPAANAEQYEWRIFPVEAGSLTPSDTSCSVHWNSSFEGTASIVVKSESQCGESQWSEPHFVQVYSCIGVEEFETDGIRLKVYPNPAKGFVVFEVQSSKFEVQGSKFEVQGSKFGGSVITILNIFGQKVAELPVRSEKMVWETGGVEAGLYFYRVKAGSKKINGKLVIQK